MLLSVGLSNFCKGVFYAFFRFCFRARLRIPQPLRNRSSAPLSGRSGGEAAVTRYRVFPGMELDYRDVHARACRELRDGSGERLEIHHCLEGRVEYRQNGRYFYLSPG